jgi:hypothetical protein
MLMFQEAAYIIDHSFEVLSYQICLTELRYIPEENHSKIYTSTWTTHVGKMHNDPLNVFTQKDSADTAPGIQPGRRTK